MPVKTCLKLMAAAAVLLGAVQTSLAGPRVRLVGLDGAEQSGTLSQFSAETIELENDAGATISLPVTELQLLDFPEVPAPSIYEVAPAVELVLTDGSRIAGEAVTVESQQAVLTAEGLGELKIPLLSVKSIRLGNPEDVENRWTELQSQASTADLLVVRKGEVLDFVEGTSGAMTADAVSFLVDDRDAQAPRSRVFGVIYRTPLVTTRPRAVLAAGRHQLQVAELTFANEQWQVQTPGKFAVNIPVALVHRLQFAGSVRQLTDLPRTVALPGGDPKLGEYHYFRAGGPPLPPGAALRVGAEEIVTRQGLWIKAGVVARYRINREFRRFTALVGHDHNAGPSTPVRLRVLGDERELLNLQMEYSAAAQEIDLDVAGVRDLEIRVERVPEGIEQNLLGQREYFAIGFPRLVK